MTINGERKHKDFYSECEWRFIPWVEAVGGGKHGFLLREEVFRDKVALQEANDERRRDRMLEFEPDYVRYLLVQSAADVPKLMQFINAEMPRHSKDVLDVLKTRITVLDEICRDF